MARYKLSSTSKSAMIPSSKPKSPQTSSARFQDRQMPLLTLSILWTIRIVGRLSSRKVELGRFPTCRSNLDHNNILPSRLLMVKTTHKLKSKSNMHPSKTWMKGSTSTLSQQVTNSFSSGSNSNSRSKSKWSRISNCKLSGQIVPSKSMWRTFTVGASKPWIGSTRQTSRNRKITRS